jgi:hypothetical protein
LFEVSFDRRNFLQYLTAVSISGVAGCADSSSEENSDLNTVTTTSPPSVEDVFSATSLEDAGKLLEDGATLDLQPADDQQPDSILYREYNGEITVSLNLQQARQQRYVNNEAGNHPVVEGFLYIVFNEDQREEFLSTTEYSDLFDPEIYHNESLSLDERMLESGLNTLWYAFELNKKDGISSAHNELKAQALHNAEQRAGFDTFIWDYGIPSHGMVSAIENPTNQEQETDQQETYLIQTDPGRDQQITTWNESKYSKGTAAEPHPAHPEFQWYDETEQWKRGFYGKTAMGKNETEILDHKDFEQIPLEMAENFIEFFKEPNTQPARNLLDPMLATAYIDEENPDGDAIPSQNAITFQL